MKKTHRALLSILLVLALLAALPLTAMAEDDDYNGPGQTTSVEKGETLTTNEGHVVANAGTITTNQVVDGSPKPRVDAGYIKNNTGTVTNNVNGGYIENNQKGAVVEINHGSGTVVVTDENGDTVFEGDAPKTVEAVSTVKNNYGTVKTNSSGTISFDNETVTTTAGVENNYGRVEENARYSIVGTNAQGGVIKDNYGHVGTSGYWGDPITTNEGEVTNNRAYGVVINGVNGVVVENHSDGSDTQWDDGVVNNYGGKVIYNSGEVNNDSNGTVVENRADGWVNNYSGTVTNNYGSVYGGTVETNDVGGLVVDGTIGHWDNEKQEWVTDELVKSEVTTNYGTHVKYADVDDYNDDNGGTFYYGVHALDENEEKVYLGSYEYTNEVTIDALNTYAKEKGYKITGIQEVIEYRGVSELADDGKEETPGTKVLTSFKIAAPTQLKLLWERITSIFKPAASSGGGGGAEAVELSARKRYIGLGSVIFINEKGYKVVEIKDDAYVVVSFDALSDEDVKDLDALFAKLFTTEQQAQIKNIGQLLDAEDVLTVFGKPGNHPVYEVNKALVQ